MQAGRRPLVPGLRFFATDPVSGRREGGL